MLLTILNYFYWDPSGAMFDFDIPFLGRPILWYGFFFALGFLIGYGILNLILRDFFLSYLKERSDAKIKASYVAERLAIYVVFGTIIGARLGDVLFYQSWEMIRKDPFSILKVWEGGLASHGGAIGIIVALVLFYVRFHRQFPKIQWFHLLDWIVIPASIAGGFIRIGNFFNQEILGKATSIPWAVVFGHPADRSPPIPRHPIQLYEAGYYFLTFFVLFCLWKWIPKWRSPGKISGLFLVLVFTFRFVIEFLKEEQSVHMSADSILTMGQSLSIPFVFFGFFLLMRRRQNR